MNLRLKLRLVRGAEGPTSFLTMRGSLRRIPIERVDFLGADVAHDQR